MTQPTPPAGYVLHHQTYNGHSTSFDPPIAMGDFISLMVWNPWQAAWERPKYVVSNVEAWLATKPTPYEEDE